MSYLKIKYCPQILKESIKSLALIDEIEELEEENFKNNEIEELEEENNENNEI